MEKERRNFVYGNPEEGVPGCLANGISESVANHIYDEMTDFAKYAFNKSHAAAYAVVSYQTAWLKYYYPVEFMAALMTSVIDNPGKVSEYFLTCRQMGIHILPPDINEGEAGFSVSGGNIRYGLTAIKSIGRPVIAAIVKEREENGRYKSLKDFIQRLSGKEVNKRTIESFIKAGALDSLGGTRKQFMQIYIQIMDQVNQEKKYSMTGQLSLFDFVGEEQKQEFEIRLPNVGEYDREALLGFEKEVLGVYISGHPLEEYEERWKKSISAVTTDFQWDDEAQCAKVYDGSKVIIGGMITSKTIKHTKNNKMMAFLTIEDLVGTVEVVVFPKDYETNSTLLVEDSKVFVQGRVSGEEEKDSKLICEKIIPFDAAKKELWLRFSDMNAYQTHIGTVMDIMKESDGRDCVVLYIESPKSMKRLPERNSVCIDQQLLVKLTKVLGKNSVKVVEKGIEITGWMH